jgi:hypothetical protein
VDPWRLDPAMRDEWPWLVPMEPLRPGVSHIVVETALAVPTRRLLREFGIAAREEALGPYTAFEVLLDAGEDAPPVVWNGQVCLAMTSAGYAYRRFRAGAEAVRAGAAEAEAARAFQDALVFWPCYREAAQQLGLSGERMPLGELRSPARLPYSLRFESGLVLCALTCPASAAPGETVTVLTGWTRSRPIGWQFTRPGAFLHVLDGRGRIVAQADELLLAAYEPYGRAVLMEQPPNSPLIHAFQATLPPTLTPGSYSLAMGICEPDMRRQKIRLAGAGNLRIDKRRAIWPDCIRIGPEVVGAEAR